MANNVACEIMLINPCNENFNFVFNSLKELPILTDCSLSCGMSPWVRGSKFKVRSVVCVGNLIRAVNIAVPQPLPLTRVALAMAFTLALKFKVAFDNFLLLWTLVVLFSPLYAQLSINSVEWHYSFCGFFTDLLLVTNSSSLMIIVENRETKHTYRVQYTPIDLLLTVQDENIYYDLGKL
ncbi:hypothetical protein GQX74_009641 [Glossina fuscipes]|nr:hypothetical protein GQX74_009641 [Glossina fuscipes]